MPTKIIQAISEMQSLVNRWNVSGKTIGFVPTMGALHEGHVSLVRKAREENDITIVSIFVNPTQFGPNEDFKNYPRDFETDKKLLEKEKVDVIFHPSVEEMYDTSSPTGRSPEESAPDRGSSSLLSERHYTDLRPGFHPVGNDKPIQIPQFLTHCLCGKDRPTHFQGVAKVVDKLFHITKPDRAYFGQKDFQQTVVIQWLVEQRHQGMQIRIMPTVREHNGLALSSRNTYLTKKEKKAAEILYKSIKTARRLYNEGERDSRIIERKIHNLITQTPLARLHYAEIRDKNTLKRVGKIKKDVVFAIAASFGNARLIDNVLLSG